jgi:acyl-CoA synthetase (NDP forming)
MLGALSTSGAGASLIADRCEAMGVPLAPLTEQTRVAIDAHKMFSRVGNPLDLGIFGGMRRSGEVPALLMGDPHVSVVLALLHSMNPWQGDPYRAAMARARETTGRPVLIVSPGGLPEAERAIYESMRMDVFTEMDIVLEGIGAMLTPPPAPIPAIPVHIPPSRRRWVIDGGKLVPVEPSQAIPELPSEPLTELESLELLERFGVRMPGTILCAGFADGFPPSLQAAGEAGSFKFPVVIKKVVRGVAHKTELGFVRTGLMSEREVELAVEDMGNGPVLLQSTIDGDLEAIAGVTRADGVGLVLLAGLGGIYAEAIRDVTMWPIPTAREAIERALRGSTLGRIVTGPRWKHPGAFSAFIDVLMALQNAAVSLGDQLHAIDINPVILGAHGAIAVDALVIPTA